MTTQATPSAPTPTPSLPTPLTPTSDRDSSRDFTRSYTQIHAELRQDSAELQRQVLLWQRWIRYAAVLVAGISAVVRYGSGDTRGAWLPVAAAAGDAMTATPAGATGAGAGAHEPKFAPATSI